MPKQHLLDAAVILEDIATRRNFARMDASAAFEKLRLSGITDQTLLHISEGVKSLARGRGIRFTKGDRKLAEVLANVLRKTIVRLYPSASELAVPPEAE